MGIDDLKQEITSLAGGKKQLDVDWRERVSFRDRLEESVSWG